MGTGYKMYIDYQREVSLTSIKVNNINSETEFGFWEGRETIDAGYMWKNSIQNSISSNLLTNNNKEHVKNQIVKAWAILGALVKE